MNRICALAASAMLVATFASPVAARGGHAGGHGARSGSAHFAAGHFNGGVRHFSRAPGRVIVHPGPRVRFFFAAPIVAAPFFWYPPPVYTYPPAVVYSTPPQYIELPPANGPEASASAHQYWYFCAGSDAYYPYVKDCPGGWQRVSPRPSS